MVIYIWFCHSEFDEYLAIVDRSCTRKSNDSGESSEVNIELFFLSSICSLSSSGNIVIETKFFDGDLEVSTSRVRLLYV